MESVVMESHQESTKQYKLPFVLLSDEDKKIQKL
jgi:peroxiredoxin